MIDFLNDYVSLNTMKELSNKYPSQLFNLNCNQKECMKIIELFRELGINNIDDLLINRIEIFFETRKDLEEMFLQHNIPDLVKRINDDYMEIDILFE